MVPWQIDAFPDEVDEALWDEACKRADGIREFLKHRTGPMIAADVKQLTTELDVSRSTVYRLIKLFRSGGTVTSLVDRKRGRPKGHRVLDARREEIIRVILSKYYLTRNRPTVSQLIRDVRTNCISRAAKSATTKSHRSIPVAQPRSLGTSAAQFQAI